MKKQVLQSFAAAIILFAAFAFTGCGTTYYGTLDQQDYYDDYSYNNPVWAPSYYAGARYYYFPDIEAYYDLASRDFIFLNNGQWIFVQNLNPFYSNFDLYSSFIIIINRGVYQPWMHHHYYNSHYPRYYYIDYYDYSNIPYVRGFNENQKGAIYWPENQRERARSWDDRNIRNNRRFTYSESDRRVQQETTRQIAAQRSSRTDVDRSNTADRNRTTDVNRSNTTDRNRTTDVNRSNTTDRTRTTDVDRTRTQTGTTDQTRTQTRTTTEQTRSTTRTDIPETQRTGTATTRTDRSTASPRTDTGTNTRSDVQTTTRRTTDTNYYGEPIGRPVRVERQMRNAETTTRSRSTDTDTNTRTGTDRSNSTRSSGR